jgi:DNA ligase (NAD+)
MTAPEQRLKELRDAIRHHEECYYIRYAPEISDEQFDSLLHELERLEGSIRTWLPSFAGPTRRGRPRWRLSGGHLMPMLSLDNAYNDEDCAPTSEFAAVPGLAPVGHIHWLKQVDGLSISR